MSVCMVCVGLSVCDVLLSADFDIACCLFIVVSMTFFIVLMMGLILRGG